MFLTQLTYIHAKDQQEDVFVRGCATICKSGLVSTDDAFVAVACCEGDLCNTDAQGQLVDKLI